MARDDQRIPQPAIFTIVLVLIVLFLILTLIASIWCFTGVPFSIFWILMIALQFHFVGSTIQLPRKYVRLCNKLFLLTCGFIIIINSFNSYFSYWIINSILFVLFLLLFLFHHQLKSNVALYVKLLQQDYFRLFLFKKKLPFYSVNKLAKTSSILFKKKYNYSLKIFIKSFFAEPNLVSTVEHKKWFFAILDQYCKIYSIDDFLFDAPSYTKSNSCLSILSQTEFMRFWLENINAQTEHQVLLQAILSQQIELFSIFIQKPQKNTPFGQLSHKYISLNSLKQINLLQMAELLSEEVTINDPKTKGMTAHLASLLFISHGIVQHL